MLEASEKSDFQVKLSAWFKSEVEKMQDEKGRCLLMAYHYDTVEGYQVNCVSSICKPVKCHYLIETGYNGQFVFKILDGVTGFESFHIDSQVVEKLQHSKFWNACNLTKNRYDGLFIKADQVLGKIAAFI